MLRRRKFAHFGRGLNEFVYLQTQLYKPHSTQRLLKVYTAVYDGSRIKHAVRILDQIQSMQGTVVPQNQLKMRISIDWDGHVDACVTTLELLDIFSAANLSLPHLLGRFDKGIAECTLLP